MCPEADDTEAMKIRRVKCRWSGCTEPRCVPTYFIGTPWRFRCRFVYCRSHVDVILGGTLPPKET